MTPELNTLFPIPQVVTINGVTLSLTPFKLGELPKVFRTIEPITKLIVDAMGSSDTQIDSLVKVIVQGGDNILDLLAVGSRQSREWVDQLETDQGIQLLLAILEINSSFFVQRVLPLITKVTNKVPAGQA